MNLDGFATYDSYAGLWPADLPDRAGVEVRRRRAATPTTARHGGEGFRVIAYNVLPFGLLGSATPSFDVTPVIVGLPAPGLPRPARAKCSTNAQGFVTRTLRGSWNGFTGDATLTWTPDSSTLAYLRYARGYKTGGFNSGTISAHPLTSPEYVDAVELGAKKTWGSMLQVNGAIFYYSYQNDQQPLTVQTAAASRRARSSTSRRCTPTGWSWRRSGSRSSRSSSPAPTAT